MNNEHNKKRIIRHLKKGEWVSVSNETLSRYNWTKDEENYLKLFVKNDKPNEITNTNISDDVFTKQEAYDTLERKIKNEYTLKNYKSRVNTLLTVSGVKNEIFSDIFKDEDLISKIIKKYKDPKDYFGFLLKIISLNAKLENIIPKDTYDKLKTRFEFYKNQQILTNIKERKEDTQYEKVYNTIFEIEKELDNTGPYTMKHIIALLYTRALYDNRGIIHMNPRNYFVKVELVEDDAHINDTDNFYNLKTGRLVLNKYKTSGIYQPYDIIFSNEVKKIIEESVTRYPRMYLVEKQNGGIYSSNALSEMIQRLMKYKIDTIRKSIESYEINVKKTDRAHLACVSRHSIPTQEITYLAKQTL